MKTDLSFDIHERYELLCAQLRGLKEEHRFLISVITDPDKSRSHEDWRQYYADQNRFNALTLEIQAKQQYIDRLNESIEMDDKDIETYLQGRDPDELLARSTATYYRLDVHTRNRLQYMENELLAWIEAGNKEAQALFMKGIEDILSRNQ